LDLQRGLNCFLRVEVSLRLTPVIRAGLALNLTILKVKEVHPGMFWVSKPDRVEQASLLETVVAVELIV
jgi:hypothetical protein